MIKHLKYLLYVLRHKWFVFIECCKMGIPYQGIIHDMSKFSPVEWFPYVEIFYGQKQSPRDSTGAYDPSSIGGSFDYAWLHHQHSNHHHWQYWVLRGDSDIEKILPMPDKYRKEMLADWRGAGRAQGKPDIRAWYESNRCKMVLHPETRAWVEEMIYKKDEIGTIENIDFKRAVESITDKEVVQAYKDAEKANHREYSDVFSRFEPSSYPLLESDFVFPYDLLHERTGKSIKVCFKAMERASDNGLIEHGVSLRMGWLTEKGEELLQQ